MKHLDASRVLSAAIVAYYAVLGLIVLAPEGVYSGDIGVQYVQAQALVDNGFRSLAIDYPGEFIDRERRFFPIRPPFVMRAGDETQAIFPPASAVLQAVGVTVAGFRGMIAYCLVAAWAIFYCARRLSSPDQRLLVVVALGLASPLWFYAVSGWHHAPSMALGTAGFVSAIVGSGPAAPFLAGLWVGAGATLRDETILLVPGIAAALWFRFRSLRPLVMMAAGVVLALGMAAAVEVWWFGRPAGAHLRHAVHMLQSALHTTDAPNIDVPVLRPMTLRERYETVIWYWLFGYGNDRWIVTLAAGLAAALGLRWWLRSSASLVIWLVPILALAAIDMWEVVTAPKWLAGLQRVAPYLVFAVLPPPPGQRDGSLVARVAPITLAAYLVIAFAGVDTTGGKGLGPRLLLPLLPLLTIAAIARIHTYVRSAARWDRWTGRAGLALVGMALVIHVYGTTMAYYMRNRDDSTLVQALAASRERVVVSDDPHTAQLLFPLYYRKIIFLADSPELAASLGSVLDAERVPAVVMVSRSQEPAVTLTELQMRRREQRGRMYVTYWTR